MSGEQLVGRTIADGRYEIVRLLGEGGMGAVYQARQVAMDRMVALKLILPEVVRSPAAAARFQREMRLSAKIEHANTIRVYDFGETEGRLFLTMELLRGQTLTQVLEQAGRLELARIVRIGTQVTRALQAAHSEGVVHRDLKPDNVMLLEQYGEHDVVKVLDFGIAKSLDEQESRMTAAGAVIGTPAYMSAEQAMGQPVDQRSDLYSLGIMLYEMAAGRVPFVAPQFTALLVAHATETPPPLQQLVPDTHPGLAALVDELLRKDPAARPQTAKDVEWRLEALVGGPAMSSMMAAQASHAMVGAQGTLLGHGMTPTPMPMPAQTPMPTVPGRGPRAQGLPQAMQPHGMLPQGMPHGSPPQGMPPQGMPHGIPPQGTQPQGMQPHAVMPAGTPPPGGPASWPPIGAQTVAQPAMKKSRMKWVVLSLVVLIGGGVTAAVVATREPGAPDKPIAPATPDKPTTPATPDKPTTPATPDKPTTPAPPDKPTTPATPDKPTTPDQPTSPPDTRKPPDAPARLAAAKAKLAELGDPAPPDACPTDAAADAAELVLAARDALKDDPAKAIASADQALQKCPSAAAAHNVRGNALQKLAKLEDAGDAYARALQFAPDYEAPRFNLGVVQLRRKDPSAIATFGEILRRKPDDADAHLSRAQAYVNASSYKEAVADLEAGLSRKPDDGRAWLLLGGLRAKLKHGDANDAYCKAAALGITEATPRCKAKKK